MSIKATLVQRDHVAASEQGMGTPGTGKLTINVSNAAHKDVAHGRVALCRSDGEEEHVLEFGFITAQGGSDSQFVEVPGDVTKVVSRFVMLDEEAADETIDIDPAKPPIFDIALADWTWNVR